MTGVLDQEARRVMATLPREEAAQPEHDEAAHMAPVPERATRLADTDVLFDEPDEALEPEPDRAQLRAEAARMVLESGLSVRQAANETGLSASAVQRAVKAAERSGTTDTDGAEHSDPEDALPANFPTQAHLVRSYKHAERKLHEQARRIKELEEVVERLREVAAGTDPAALRAEFARHRRAFLADLNASAERLLALDQRVARIEGVTE